MNKIGGATAAFLFLEAENAPLLNRMDRIHLESAYGLYNEAELVALMKRADRSCKSLRHPAATRFCKTDSESVSQVCERCEKNISHRERRVHGDF